MHYLETFEGSACRRWVVQHRFGLFRLLCNLETLELILLLPIIYISITLKLLIRASTRVTEYLITSTPASTLVRLPKRGYTRFLKTSIRVFKTLIWSRMLPTKWQIRTWLSWHDTHNQPVDRILTCLPMTGVSYSLYWQQPIIYCLATPCAVLETFTWIS